ncbi:MAG: transposase, partial [Bacteroidota bacterium]
RAISKVRATQLEGSYGNDKNHYGLRKVKARNESTEVAWIFFAMMSANAVKISRYKQLDRKIAPRARAA